MPSTAATRQLHRVDDNSGFLELLEINHPAFDQPARVVNDTRDWLVGGNTYRASQFRFKAPQQRNAEAPRGTLEVDNVGRDLTSNLELLEDGAVLTATVTTVRRSDTSDKVYEWVTEISRATATVGMVVAVLGDDDLGRRGAVQMRYDPATAPALFGAVA